VSFSGPGGANDSDELTVAWRELVGAYAQSPEVDGVGQGLLASWSEPHRRYHNTAHLSEVLSHADELADHAVDPAAVKLAAWYHDAVYAGRPDDEENSARRAETELAALGLSPALIAEVARLVRLTATHDPRRGDRNGEALSDADLSILAAPPDKYVAYAAAVRSEYSHLADDVFSAGRALVLHTLLEGPAVYRTPHARDQWEARARCNLAEELRSLGTS
jgi:predicted metal-dependent HD superfamily phosphohydrolase